MSDAVTAAVISGGVTLIVCMINNWQQNRKSMAQHDETMGLIKYQLEELTERVDKHNKVVERTYALEQKAVIYEEKMKVANHRIEDLEKMRRSCERGYN